MSSIKNFFYIAADIEICYTFPKIMLQFSQISIWQIHQASCFYEYGKRAIGEQATPKSNLAYSATITDPAKAIPTSEVATRLNKWIHTTGISSFSEYKFTEWTQGEDIPAIFINERE